MYKQVCCFLNTAFKVLAGSSVRILSKTTAANYLSGSSENFLKRYILNLTEYYIVKQYCKISGLGKYQTGLQKICRNKYVRSALPFDF